MRRGSFLVEIGTEELPPGSLQKLSAAFLETLLTGLDQAALQHGEARPYCSPRRLAVRIEELQLAQADREVVRRGPALKAAFDSDGNPTRAAEGFARSCGVPVADLDNLETEQGTWLAHTKTEPGRDAAEVLPELVENALAALPVARRMRWSDHAWEFVRPVHWVVMLLDSEVVPCELYGCASGRETRGHRFHAPQPISLAHAAEYPDRLEQEGRVIADFPTRRSRIRELVEEGARQRGGRAVIGDALLDEVCALVEWPAMILGSFEEKFLAVPAEALVTTMSGNQKYFHLVDDDGNMLPAFIAIANIESGEPGRVREGNERVIRPRFADAEFFYATDRRHTLESRRTALDGLVFEARLGSVAQRCNRIGELVAAIGEQVGRSSSHAERAAHLCKCDLLTEMVQEFPKLQGIMGRYYALHDGEAPEVAEAIREHYLPRFAADGLPQSEAGQRVALADRIDLLTGIFGIGEEPSGVKDPFGLRRAALGVLRILIEGELSLDLAPLLKHAAELYRGQAFDSDPCAKVLEFLLDRLRSYYTDQGVSAEVFLAVRARPVTSPLDFHRRILAVQEFVRLPEAGALSAANKRVSNILEKSAIDKSELKLRPDLFREPEEIRLAEQIERLRDGLGEVLERHDYSTALNRLASLRDPVDQFFDAVLVNCEEQDVRENRMALLAGLRNLFLGVADISLLQSV